LLIYLDIYVVVAISLNLVVGYCGLLTLAHSGYFAIGGYAYALVTLRLGWGFIPAVLFGMVAAAVLSLFVSLATWRLKGDFFVMASLAVQALILSAANNWFDSSAPVGTWRNLANGPFGISAIPKPAIAGIQFDTIGGIATVSTVLAGLCVLVTWNLLTSPWGRVLQSVRDDELAARGLGKNSRLLKVEVFAVASGMVAIAGAIYASYVGYIDPSLASTDFSILMLCMVVIGGAANFRGPLVGAAVLLAIPEFLRFIKIPDAMAGQLRLMAFGFLLVLLMHLRPQGLAGRYRMDR